MSTHPDPLTAEEYAEAVRQGLNAAGYATLGTLGAGFKTSHAALDDLLTRCKEAEGYQEAYRQLWHRDAELLRAAEKRIEELERKLVRTRAEAEEYRELWQQAEG